jgi:hypothetical protein
MDFAPKDQTSQRGLTAKRMRWTRGGEQARPHASLYPRVMQENPRFPSRTSFRTGVSANAGRHGHRRDPALEGTLQTIPLYRDGRWVFTSNLSYRLRHFAGGLAAEN